MMFDRRKSNLVDLVSRNMQEGGFEAREEWTQRVGLIHAGVRGETYSAFSVRLEIFDTHTIAGILREDDRVVEGHPVPYGWRKPDKSRSFGWSGTGEAERQRFTAALKSEVAEWRTKFDGQARSDEAEGLAESLQELISHDPDAAGEALATLLKDRMGADDLASLREAVDEARREALGLAS